MSCDLTVTSAGGAVGFLYGVVVGFVTVNMISHRYIRDNTEYMSLTHQHELAENKLVIDELQSRIENAINAAKTLQKDLEENIYADMPPLMSYETFTTDDDIPPPSQDTDTYYSDMLEQTCHVTYEFATPNSCDSDKND